MAVLADEKTKAERIGRADHAAYLEQTYGFKMIPVHSIGPDGTCSCTKGRNCPREKSGKHPQGNEWQKNQSGIDEIKKMAQLGRNFNIGVLVEPSGLVVLDIDPRNGGTASMKELVAKYGPPPKTRIVKTGSDGWHYYFKAPKGVELAGTLGPGLDLKHNGMVIAEMSTSGMGSYTLLSQDEAVDIAELPQWIIDEAGRDPSAPHLAGPAKPLDESDPDLPRREAWCISGIKGEFGVLSRMAVEAKPRGEGYNGPPWNNTCFSVACNMWEFVNTPEARLDAATMVDQFLQNAPQDENFGEKEILAVIESARKKVGDVAREIPKPPIDPFVVTVADPDDAAAPDADGKPDVISGERHSGQLRMAYRLVELAEHELMHVRGIGWLYWTGTHWAEDEIGRSMQLVIKVLRKALVESVGDKELRQDVTKCESASAMNGILTIAATMPAFARVPADLDSDPFLLNAPNGTWDFRTRELRDHDPDDRITKVTEAKIVDDADSHDWDRFLDQVLPEKEVREFLRRALGQGLLGLVLEHAFLILTGLGGNGKGVFYGALTKALGTYGTVIDPALLLQNESGKTGGPELLQLMGARTVVGSETGESRKLDEATMKRLTGGDRLSARNLYKSPVTWAPSHQLVYVTNHLPTVKGNDPAVWRRVRVVPFDIVVAEEDRDPELGTKLEASMEAILAWVIRGYYDYREIGMAEPASVRAATDDYQKSSDAVRRFVEEDCLVSPAATATTRELSTAWHRWAIAEGTELLSEKALVGELRRLGHESKRSNRGVVWKGLSPLVVEGDE